MAENSDQYWMEALRNGDEQAFRRIFDAHYPKLVQDIYRVIPDVDSAKDLAQEIFVELWRKREELNIHSSLRAYLRRAAQNRAINHIKSSKRYVFDDAQADQQDNTPLELEQQAVQSSLEDALHSAIAALPEKCRAVFALSRFEQLSHKEIAEKLDISVKTIENQITKAMKLLREALSNVGHLSSIVILTLKYLIGT